jgi:hypothetical protein
LVITALKDDLELYSVLQQKINEPNQFHYQKYYTNYLLNLVRDNRLIKMVKFKENGTKNLQAIKDHDTNCSN